jgi:hypothetical protein
MSLHLALGSAIERIFPDDIDGPVEHAQDVLTIRLKNGVKLDVRYAAADAYSLRWTYGDAESGIDTAPLHPELTTFPNHLHDVANRIVADPITRPGAPPELNLQNLIRALLDDPMLGVKYVD